MEDCMQQTVFKTKAKEMMNYLENELRNLVRKDDKIFDFLQESSLDGLWYWDLTNPEEEWMNDTFWKCLGYDPDKMPNKSSAWMDIIFPEDLEVARQKVAEHIEHPDRPYDQITRYTHADGHTVWIRCRGMIMRDEDGTPIRMLGAHTDVTALKQKEKILERCNAAANIGHWEMDLEKGSVSFSNVTKKILGLDTDSSPDQAGPAIYFKEGTHRSRVENAFSSARESKREQKTQAKIITREGTEKWCEILVISEFCSSACTKIFGTLQDIDEKKRSALKVDELLRKSEKQNGRLMNFAHTISHNLRSQVGGVNSFIEIMEIDNPDIVNDDVFKYLKIASKKLTQTVVHLSEIAVGDEFNEEDFVACRLRPMVDETVNAVIKFEELDTIVIENRVPEDLSIDTIEGYLESILHNLITNAIKYRDPEKSPRVEIDAGSDDSDNMWFSVTDNGLGIDMDKHRDRLFGLHTTFHDHEDSSGVGLFVTKNQILAMDGNIEVESEPGVGSTFRVILPTRSAKLVNA